MSAAIDLINGLAGPWWEAVSRACWQAAFVLGLAWALCRALPRLSPRVRSWIFRLAYLRILVALFWVGSIELPFMPAWLTPATGNASPGPVTLGSLEFLSGPAVEDAGGSAGPEPSLSSLGWLWIAWALGVGLLGLALGRGWREARRLSRRAAPVRKRRAHACLARLGQAMGLSRLPGLVACDAGAGPMLVGLVNPTIVLPSRWLKKKRANDLRLLIAHELAHARRHDLLWSCLTTLVQTLLFFHPVIWMTRREADLTHEMACDELAIQVTRSPPRDYGNVLVRLLTPIPDGAWTRVAALGAGSFEAIRRRLAMLRHVTPAARVDAGLWLGLVALALGAVSVPFEIVASDGRPAPAASLERALDHGLAVRSVAFSPDGRTLVSAGARGTTRQWDVDSGALLRTLAGERSLTSTAAYSPDGATLAASYGDDAILLVDLRRGAPPRLFKGRAGLKTVVFSPDGRTLAAASAQGAVDLIDTAAWTRRSSLPGYRRPGVAFSPDGSVAATRTGPGRITLLDSRTGHELRTLTAGRGGEIEQVAFSPDGAIVAGVVGSPRRDGRDGAVGLWRTATAERIRVIGLGDRTPRALAFSPDGRSLAIGHEQGVTLADVSGRRPLETLVGHDRSVFGVAFSPDGHRLAAGGADRTVRVWRLQGKGPC